MCYENAHHNYVPDFTPAFRLSVCLSVCHTRDPRLTGLISKCLLHVRCALTVRVAGKWSPQILWPQHWIALAVLPKVKVKVTTDYARSYDNLAMECFMIAEIEFELRLLS